jgi:hypothetical protein
MPWFMWLGLAAFVCAALWLRWYDYSMSRRHPEGYRPGLVFDVVVGLLLGVVVGGWAGFFLDAHGLTGPSRDETLQSARALVPEGASVTRVHENPHERYSPPRGWRHTVTVTFRSPDDAPRLLRLVEQKATARGWEFGRRRDRADAAVVEYRYVPRALEAVYTLSPGGGEVKAGRDNEIEVDGGTFGWAVALGAALGALLSLATR